MQTRIITGESEEVRGCRTASRVDCAASADVRRPFIRRQGSHDLQRVMSRRALAVTLMLPPASHFVRQSGGGDKPQPLQVGCSGRGVA